MITPGADIGLILFSAVSSIPQLIKYQMTIILSLFFCYDDINEYFDNKRNEGTAIQ